jgi:hypothetical protein
MTENGTSDPNRSLTIEYRLPWRRFNNRIQLSARVGTGERIPLK